MKTIKNRTNGKTKRFASIALAALLILAAGAALWYLPKEYAYRRQLPRDQNLNPVDGAWDLTAFDLDREIVFLEGDVEYVVGALLTPAEFEAYEGDIHYGGVPSDASVVTARLRLRLPDDRTYTLAAATADYSERAYVNGELRYEAGTPGLSMEESTAGKVFVVLDVTPQDGVVEIVRQGSNFVHKEGSGYTGYYVGSPANIRQMAAADQMFTAVGIGLLLCLFLLHMILFLVVGGYRPNLWFALLCLIWMLRAGFTGRLVLLAVFPDVPWTLTYKLGCVSVALTGALLLLLARDEFPGLVQKWPLRFFLGLQGALALLYLFAGTVFDSHAKIAAELLVYLEAAYLAMRFAMTLPGQVRQKKLLPEQAVTLVGLAIALFALLHDALRYNNWTAGIFYYEIGDAGILVLALLQMTAMVMGTLRQLTEARQNARIAWESAEVARKSEKLALLEAENARQDLELHRQLVAGIPKEALVVCGSLTLDTEKSRAFLKDENLQLSPKEFSLLLYFIRHEDEAIRKEALYEAVWNQPFAPKDRALASNLYRLRKKLESSGYAINSVYGQGFLFEKQ